MGKVSAAVDTPSQQLQDRWPGEAQVHIDETGHREKGKGWGTWCFRAADYTWCTLDPSRSSAVLTAVLGQLVEGGVRCDYFSAYRTFMAEAEVRVQVCLAHLSRDVK